MFLHKVKFLCDLTQSGIYHAHLFMMSDILSTLILSKTYKNTFLLGLASDKVRVQH